MEYTKKSSQDLKTFKQFADDVTYKEYLLNVFMIEQGENVASAINDWTEDNYNICKEGVRFKSIDYQDNRFVIEVIDVATKCPFELETHDDERGLFLC